MSGWNGSTRRERLPANWKTLRTRVLTRDEHRCQTCGAEATHVDHIEPGDDHAMSNLQALCVRCHLAKTAREGGARLGGIAAQAKRPKRRREPERHPGLIYDDD